MQDIILEFIEFEPVKDDKLMGYSKPINTLNDSANGIVDRILEHVQEELLRKHKCGYFDDQGNVQFDESIIIVRKGKRFIVRGVGTLHHEDVSVENKALIKEELIKVLKDVYPHAMQKLSAVE